MVTSRQFTRGVVRTMRAMDRAAKQSERQRLVQEKALAREALLDASAHAAAMFEEIMDALVGAHRVRYARRDWGALATEALGSPPERADELERAAAARLDAYAPGWLARVLGREPRVRAQLEQQVVEARAKDDAAHSERIAAVERRNRDIQEAQRVVEGSPDAMARALEEHSQIGNLPFSVEGMDTIFIDDRLVAVVDGLDLEDIPDESVSLLKSGKASIKAIPIGKRHELHRDAVCSAAVRVASEVLSTLPIDVVEVMMMTDILDRSSGHIAAAPVLHLRVADQALRALNLSMTDAHALVERLGGHLEWSKRDGFRPINAAAFGIDLVP